MSAQVKTMKHGRNCLLPLFAYLACQTTAKTSRDVRECLIDAVDGSHHLVVFPENALYQLKDVQRWNLDLHVTSSAVTNPENAEQISAIIRCASRSKLKVQAKSGEHSFGNYGE